MNAIRCEGLSKMYRGVQALTDLNVTVPSGAIYALVGPNGAGKSTAIKTMLNILKPTGGSAAVLGCDSRRLSASEAFRPAVQPQAQPAVARHVDEGVSDILTGVQAEPAGDG